ncbi:uncharacterized protein [Aegilops tauschii subsp. strangulata]|uniref:uncharacterized protein isoform X3 n=1 Tax=Aegilops tauschii subsp. strangulata TaxID=200361 RepID=UPI003CC876F0
MPLMLHGSRPCISTQVSPFLLQLVLQPDMWLRSYCGEVKLAGLMVEASGFTGDMAECYSKKYTWLEMDYGRSDKETKEDFCCQSDKRGKAGDSDISMMKQQMMEIGKFLDYRCSLNWSEHHSWKIL